MWAAVLSKVLKAYLSEIVEDTGDLNVALRKGKVVLNNVIVKENLLEWTGLPLKVAKGSRIGKLEINFLNLRNLSAGGKPVLVNIENINIGVIFPGAEDPAVAVERIQGVKKRKLKTFEIYEEHIYEGTWNQETKSSKTSKDTGNSDGTFRTRMLQRLFNNLHVSITNLNVSFFDVNTRLGRPILFGVHVKEIGLQRVNERWQPCSVSSEQSGSKRKQTTMDADELTRKLGFANKISCYTANTDTLKQIEAFKAGQGNPKKNWLEIFSSLPEESRVFLVDPASVEVRVSVTNSQSRYKCDSQAASSGCFKYTVEASVEQINVRMKDSHLKDIFYVLSKIQTSDVYTLRLQLQGRRPDMSPLQAPRKWWKYAFHCIKAHLDPARVGLPHLVYRRGRLSWRSVMRLILEQRRYIQLRKRKLGAPWLAKFTENGGLESLERNFTFEQIVLFRRLAFAELNVEKKTYESKKHGTNMRKVLKIKRSRDKSKHLLSDQQRLQLYEEMLDSEHAMNRTGNGVATGLRPGNNLKKIFPYNILSVELRMKTVSISFLNETTVSEEKFRNKNDGFMTIGFEAILFKITTQSHDPLNFASVASMGYSMRLNCRSMKATDIFNPGSVFPPLMTYDIASEDDEDLFTFSITQKSNMFSKNEVDVRGKAAPIQIVFTPELSSEIKRFLFCVEDNLQFSSESLTKVSAQQIRASIEAKVAVDVNVSIGAPKIIFPADLNDDTMPVFVLDMGVILFASENNVRLSASEYLTEYPEVAEAIDSEVCDFYKLLIIDFGIFVFENANDLKIQNRTLEILNLSNIVTAVNVSLVPEDDRIPLVSTNCELPELVLGVSRRHFSIFVEMFESYCNHLSHANVSIIGTVEDYLPKNPIEIKGNWKNANEVKKGFNGDVRSPIGKILYTNRICSQKLSLIVHALEGNGELFHLNILDVLLNRVSRSFDSSISLNISKIDAVDCQETVNPTFFRLLPISVKDEQAQDANKDVGAAKLTLFACNPVSSNFSGLTTYLSIGMGKVEINWNHETVSKLISLASDRKKSTANPLQQETASSESGKIKHKLHEQYHSGSVLISCNVMFVDLYLNESCSNRSITKIALAKSNFDYQVLQNCDSSLIVKVGSISMYDTSLRNHGGHIPPKVDLNENILDAPSNSSKTITPRIFGLKKNEDAFLDIQYRHTQVRDTVVIKAGSVELIFLHTLFVRIVEYVDSGITGVVAAFVAREARAVFEEIHPPLNQLSLEAVVDHPIIVLPAVRHSYDPVRDDKFKIDMGKLKVIKNEAKAVGAYKVFISDASLVSSAKGTGQFWKNDVKMVDNFSTSIEVEIKPNGWTSANVSPNFFVDGVAHKIPSNNVSVFVEVSNIEMVASQSQFAMLENFFAWNCVDWRQGKAKHAAPKLPLFADAAQQNAYNLVMDNRPNVVKLLIHVETSSLFMQRGWGRHMMSSSCPPKVLFRMDIFGVKINLRHYIGRVMKISATVNDCTLRDLGAEFSRDKLEKKSETDQIVFSFHRVSEIPCEINLTKYPAADLDLKVTLRDFCSTIYLPTALTFVNFFVSAHDYDEGGCDAGCQVFYRLPEEKITAGERHGIISECFDDYTFNILLNGTDPNGADKLYHRLSKSFIRSHQRVHRFVNRKISTSLLVKFTNAKISVVDTELSKVPFKERPALVFVGDFKVTAARDRKASSKMQVDLNGIQVCQKFANLETEHPIVEDCEIVFNFSQYVFAPEEAKIDNKRSVSKKPVYYDQLEIKVEQFNCTLGIPHIQVILKIAQSLLDLFNRTEEMKDRSITSFCPTAVDHSLVNTTRWTIISPESFGRYSERLNAPVLEIQRISEQVGRESDINVVMNASNMRVIIVSDSYKRGNTVPILRMRISNACAKVALPSGQDKAIKILFLDSMKGNSIAHSDKKLRTGISVYVYNPNVVTWEPLLEPWAFSVDCCFPHDGETFDSGHRPSRVDVRSSEDFCLNLSHAFVTLFHMWWESELSLIGVNDDNIKIIEPSSTLHYEYSLENATGLPLQFDHNGMTKKVDVAPGGVAPFSFPQTLIHEKWYENPWTNIQGAAISVDLNLPVKQLQKVQVQKIGRFVYDLQSIESNLGHETSELEKMFLKKEWTLPKVLCDVSLQGGSLMVRLASLTRVVNKTSTALEVLLCGGPAAAVVKILRPMESYSLPIHLMHHGRLTVRPVGAESYTDYLWWEGVDLFPLFSGVSDDAVTKNVLCSAENCETADWVAYIKCFQIKATNSQQNYFELILFSPVKLVNALPYPIFLRMKSNKSQVQLWNGLLQAGCSTEVNCSPLQENDLTLFFSFNGSVWSKEAHIEDWRRIEKRKAFLRKNREVEVAVPPDNSITVPWPTSLRKVKPLRLCIDNSIKDFGREVVLFCPYWLINRSMLSLSYAGDNPVETKVENPVEFSTHEFQSKPRKLIKRLSFSEFLSPVKHKESSTDAAESSTDAAESAQDPEPKRPERKSKSDENARPILYASSDRLSIAVDGADFSEHFSINTAGTDGCVSCVERKGNAVSRLLSSASQKGGITKHLSSHIIRRLYQIGVSIRSAPGVFRRSTMVIFAPKYFVINRMKQNLQVTQAQIHRTTNFVAEQNMANVSLYQNEMLNLKPGTGEPFHWYKADVSSAEAFEIVVRIEGDGWLWSGSFSIANVRGMAIKLRNRITGEIVVIRIQIKSEDTTSYILIADENDSFPLYKFVNRSDELIHFHQKSISGDNGVVERIFPGESKIFGWDFPSEPNKLLILSNRSGLGQTEYRLDEIGMKKSILGAPSGKRRTRIDVYTEVHGPTKALIFNGRAKARQARAGTLASAPSSVKTSARLRSPSDGAVGRPVTVEQSGKSGNTCKLIFTVGLSNAKICLINADPQEVALISLMDMVVVYGKWTQKDQTLEFLLKDMQIDNQLTMSIFPVLLTPIPNRNNKLPFFHMSVAKPHVNDEVEFFSYVSLLVQEFQISIDRDSLEILGEFVFSIGDILEATRVRSTDTETTGKEEFDPFKVGLVNLNLSDTLFKAVNSDEEIRTEIYYRIFNPHRQVYVQLMHLHPLKMRLKFAATTQRNLDYARDHRYPRVADEMYGKSILPPSLLSLLVDIDNAPIRMNAMLHTDVFVDLNTLRTSIQQHYIGQAKADLYRIIGAVDVLGNPAGLVRGLGTGMADFFYEPAQGLIRSPGAFGLGLARGTYSLVSGIVGGALNTASKLSGGVGSGLAQLSFDSAYKEKRKILKHEEAPKDIAEGVIYGTKALGKGLFLGVTGLVVQPYEGAKSAGVHGFLKGVAKGIVGIAIKPTVGVLDSASNLTQGISGTATALMLKPRLIRLRRPRLMYSRDRILKVYKEEEAYVKELMESVLSHRPFEASKGFHPNFYVTHVGLPYAKLLLVTTEFVALWSCQAFLDGLDNSPKITWSIRLKDVTHINVTTSGKAVTLSKKVLFKNKGKLMYKISNFIIPSGSEITTAAVLSRLHTVVLQSQEEGR